MEEFCLLLRDMKLPIYRDSIFDYVIKLIERTPQQELLKHNPALNSSSLWHMSKGVTSDEAFAIVQELSLIHI